MWMWMSVSVSVNVSVNVNVNVMHMCTSLRTMFGTTSRASHSTVAARLMHLN